MVRRNLPALIGLVVMFSLLLSCAPAAPTDQKPVTAPTAVPILPPGASPKTAPAATPTAATAETGKPVYGGTFTYSFRDSPSSLDVHQMTQNNVLFNGGGCYNTLLTWDHIDHQKMIPDLAKRWELSQDGLTYTFYTRGRDQVA